MKEYDTIDKNKSSYLTFIKNYDDISDSYDRFKELLDKINQVQTQTHILQYNIIINSQCYLCGRKSYEKYKNGIDRIDNKLGYIMSNVKPCCGGCNYIKKDMELGELFNKMSEIYLKCKNKVETTTVINNTHKPSKNIVKNMIKSYEGECLCYKIVNNNY